MIKKKL